MRCGTLSRRLRDDRGAAVVEFPMLAALLTLFFVVVLQAAVVMHVRNTAVDAAVAGARTASLSGNTIADGEARTRMLLESRFGGDFVSAVHGAQGEDGVIRMEVRTALPVVGWLGPQGVLVLDGHALDEDSIR